MGIKFSWVVECKCWKRKIPKEKVAALSAIIQDIGADKGFLLSETCFQSGPLRLAEKTNITLSNLDDLTSVVGIRYVRHRMQSPHFRIHAEIARLRALQKELYDDWLHHPAAKPLGKILLGSDMEEARRGKFPLPIPPFDADAKLYYNLEDWLTAAEELVTDVETMEAA